MVADFPDDELKYGGGGLKLGWKDYDWKTIIFKMKSEKENKHDQVHFTVTMDESAMDSMEAWYFMQDDEGHLLEDTRKLLTKPCESQDNGRTKCTYMLGYYGDYMERGLA